MRCQLGLGGWMAGGKFIPPFTVIDTENPEWAAFLAKHPLPENVVVLDEWMIPVMGPPISLKSIVGPAIGPFGYPTVYQGV
jgi:hypothetical protein